MEVLELFLPVSSSIKAQVQVQVQVQAQAQVQVPVQVQVQVQVEVHIILHSIPLDDYIILAVFTMLLSSWLVSQDCHQISDLPLVGFVLCSVLTYFVAPKSSGF